SCREHTACAGRIRELRNLDDHLNFDGDVPWQRDHPDGGAGVAAAFAEDLDGQVAGTVDDFGLAREVRRAVHLAVEFHHANDPLEIADLDLQVREKRQHGPSGGLVAPFDGQVGADLAGD